MQLFTVSGSPHVHNNQTVQKIMWGVVIAMVPALLVSLWYFGLGALVTTAIAVLSCVTIEYAVSKYILKEQPSIYDGSAVVTGILLAFNVPSSIPWWQLVIGSIVAIGVAKMSFGGLGRNPFNPALVGRVFMLISFPVDMTLWPLPVQNRFVLTDAITGPTSLGIVKEGVKNSESLTELASKIPDYASMLIGNMGGSLGEVSALALLLGGFYMLYKKIITWHIPVSYLFTVFAFTGILWLINPEIYIDPVFHMVAGGLMLGAIFMATDMATSPMTWKGMLVYGFGCGVLTVLIRVWGSYPEGVSFAILIMNAATPLINKGFKPDRFGEKVKSL